MLESWDVHHIARWSCIITRPHTNRIIDSEIKSVYKLGYSSVELYRLSTNLVMVAS